MCIRICDEELASAEKAQRVIHTSILPLLVLVKRQISVDHNRSHEQSPHLFGVHDDDELISGLRIWLVKNFGDVVYHDVQVKCRDAVEIGW
jgi:hypothetical protein